MNLRSLAKRAIYLGIGTCYVVLQTPFLCFNFLRNPRRFLHRSDWTNIELSPPLPDCYDVMVDVSPDISIHTVRAFKENPTKPCLIMIHGFPEYWASWKHQITDFRNEYDLVALSLRGYCLSSKPQDYNEYSIDKLVNDVVAVIKSLGVDKVVLMAHDWGGSLAWHVAHMHPELISKLIIASAPHPKAFLSSPDGLDWTQFFKSWYIFLFQIPYIPEINIAAFDYDMIEKTFVGSHMGMVHRSLTQAEIDGYKKEIARPGALTAALNYYRAAMASVAYGGDPEIKASLRRKLPRDLPVLVIWADKDGALGVELAPKAAKYVENFRMIVLENCSHWVQQDRPEEFNAAVKAFLKE